MCQWYHCCELRAPSISSTMWRQGRMEPASGTLVWGGRRLCAGWSCPHRWETAEMPGMYGGIWLGWFAVGVAQKNLKSLTVQKVAEGDVLLGLSQGFIQWILSSVVSLPKLRVRRSCQVEASNPGSSSSEPTRIYVKAVCHSSKEKLVQRHCPSLVVALSKMSLVCLQLTWLLRLKNRFSFTDFQLLRNAVKSNIKKCLKSSIWVWDSCWQLALKM